ncbi:hypothetical protein N9105_04815 [Akkermansiaceae bacterium]|nr:hypothetical protein [Akkermansiaceae bacterium]MDB4578610.1 hypothetical protein [Akkermansiaceae bacterium]MDB4769626.1 hypothetical protein [bacterium]
MKIEKISVRAARATMKGQLLVSRVIRNHIHVRIKKIGKWNQAKPTINFLKSEATIPLFFDRGEVFSFIEGPELVVLSSGIFCSGRVLAGTVFSERDGSIVNGGA